MNQVNTEHYDFSSYLDQSRWISYWHQLDEVLKVRPSSVLIIGVGDGLIPQYLEHKVNTVHTLDISSELNPTHTGSILELETILKNRKYDLIVCCQVLEHLPYDSFTKCLKQLKNSCSKLILSLPYCHHKIFAINITIRKLKLMSFTIKIPKFYKNWSFDGQHYWEIGTKQTPACKVETDIKTIFGIKRKYIVSMNTYHMFYICE